MPPRPRYLGRTDSHLRATELFVDRDGPISIFTEAARAIGDGPCQLLTFYGVGGQGKTQLCRKLCGLLADGSIAPNLRWGMVDLHEQRERQPAYLLLWTRNALKKTGRVRFPAFDYAFELFWKEAHGKQPMPTIDHPWWEEAQEDIGVAIEVGAPLALEHIPFLGPVLGRLGRHAVRFGRHKILRHTNDALQHLFHRGGLVPAHEIELRLPFILAREVDAWREDHPDDRFVLLIDEYESALESGGASNLLRPNDFDAAMRDLVAECRATLFVFFSREMLRWDRIDRSWGEVLDGRQHLLGGLARNDAVRFLQLASVKDAMLRTAMIEGASAEDPVAGEVTAYPIMLDLQVALYESLSDAGIAPQPVQFDIGGTDFAAKRQELLGRLLRSYTPQLEATLKRLAIAQRFDRALFACVIDAFHTGLPLDEWPVVTGLSFVLPTTAEGIHAFHAVVREGLAASLDDKAQAATHETMFQYFEQAALAVDIPRMTAVHALAAVQAFHHCRSLDPKTALLWWDSNGRIFHDAGFDRLLEEIDRACIAIAAEVYGENSSWHSARLLWHAINLDAQGRHTDAELLHRRALAIYEKVLGPEHGETAASLGNFGYNLDRQGRHAEAETVHRRALAIWDKVLGAEHRETATSLNTLGWNLDQQGRHLEAQTLHWRALAIREKVLGPEHRDTAASRSTLGWNLDQQGRHADAETLHRRALAIREKALGPEHRDTAASLSTLGWNLDQQGRHPEAEPLHRRALTIREKVLGPAHRDTATSLSTLGWNLDQQGRHPEAEPLHRRDLAISEKVLGPEHRDTAVSLNNLGSNLDQQGRHAEAETLHRRALAITEKMLGPEHRDTAGSLGGLGSNFDDQSRHAEAERLHRRALAIREKVLAASHWQTAVARSALAACLDDLQRHGEAGPLHQQAIAALKTALGPTHARTAWASFRLARHRFALGETETACGMARRALAILLARCGPEHSRVRRIAAWLAEHCRGGDPLPE
jgi:tetratricopeptide (TPR) repeat protein